MILTVGILMVVCLAHVAAHYWERLFAAESPWGLVPIRGWICGGLAIPCLTWLFINSGLLAILPPLIPQIAIAQSTGQSWGLLFLRQTVPGLLIISSFWAAVSFAHMAIWIAVQTEARHEFALAAGLVSLVVLPFAWLCWSAGGWPWAGFALLLWLLPVTHCTAWLAWKPKAPPSYSRAIARMKLGKFQEAESEVIQQLEQRDDDFEGWMMLAELYATQFADLTEADRTIRAVCNQPNITALQVSLAFHRLADWHLKTCDDPVSAARALGEIVTRLPGTHFAQMARLRIQQLPSSRKEWLEQKSGRTIRLPALTGDLDQPGPSPGPKLSRQDAAALANECGEQLRQNPNNAASREKLAIILTEQLGKADLGIEQVQLLLGMGGQPEQKKAEWLSLLAVWRYRHQHDRPGARQALQQLIREHPHTVQGFTAQRWLNLLEMEEQNSKSAAEAHTLQAKPGAI